MKYVLLFITFPLFIAMMSMVTNTIYAQDLYHELSQMFENLTPNTIGGDNDSNSNNNTSNNDGVKNITVNSFIE